MPRLVPQIREARPEDAAELLELWADSARSGMHTLRAQEDAERGLASMAADPDQRLLVAESEDHIVAAIKLSRAPISPLVLESVVHTSFLIVARPFRRHGYGHALLDAALLWAEEKDINEVTAITDGNRETNRFFARLGLATLGTLRHSTVAGLRKKLTSERRHRGVNRHLVEVIAQRRSLRRRQESV